MNIKKVLPKFEALKKAVLADEKIDIDEVDELIDFIKPYCRSANMKFLQLMRILIICKDDGKITEMETRAIVEALDDVSRFLKIERVIELVISVMATLVIGSLAVWIYVAKMM